MILSIETSGTVCSVALHEQETLLGASEISIQKSHSRLITILIQELMRNCNIKLSDLDAIAVSAGPGSYTGLRIGVSTAKGLCFALGKPLIAVNTLLGMAKALTPFFHFEYLLCPMIDARRMEVYYSLFRAHTLEIVEPVNPKIIDSNAFKNRLKSKKIVFFGSGAEKCKDLIKDPSAIFIDEINPSAIHIGAIAWQKYQKNEFEDVIYFEPFYLKNFIYSTLKK